MLRWMTSTSSVDCWNQDFNIRIEGKLSFWISQNFINKFRLISNYQIERKTFDSKQQRFRFQIWYFSFKLIFYHSFSFVSIGTRKPKFGQRRESNHFFVPSRSSSELSWCYAESGRASFEAWLSSQESLRARPIASHKNESSLVQFSSYERCAARGRQETVFFLAFGMLDFHRMRAKIIQC